MQGADVQRQMVEDQTHIPVVLMSAHGDENTVRLVMQHDAVGFPRKPFAQDALFDLILAAVEKREK
ncbi:response regulator [Paraburkholderia phytofirmans]|uniref:response regulator n=1 Tax=Paraburkholderia phytofirmans TaxID=261302 RepID=UPI0038BB775F